MGCVGPDTVAAGSLLSLITPRLTTELDDPAVMDHAVDRSCRGQGISEDLTPLPESEIGGDNNAAAFGPFRQGSE